MIKNLIYKILSIFDVKISRYSSSIPLDLSKKKFHPRTISNLIEERKVIVKLDLKNGRTNRFFDLKPNSFDPYLFAIRQCLKKDLEKDNLYLELFELINVYKKKLVLKNISNLFGLNSNENKILNSYPVWSAILPWENISIDQKVRNFPKSVKVDRAKNGLVIKSDDPNVIMKEDENNSLPSHINQYITLINSIQKNGYIPDFNNNYIETELLVKGDNFCWKPSGEGNHRTTVVASLGYTEIKSVVKKIVRFEDLEYWPNVINGLFEKNEAEQIFNRFFDAKPPEFNNDWILYCKELIDSET